MQGKYGSHCTEKTNSSSEMLKNWFKVTQSGSAELGLDSACQTPKSTLPTLLHSLHMLRLSSLTKTASSRSLPWRACLATVPRRGWSRANTQEGRWVLRELCVPGRKRPAAGLGGQAEQQPAGASLEKNVRLETHPLTQQLTVTSHVASLSHQAPQALPCFL